MSAVRVLHFHVLQFRPFVSRPAFSVIPWTSLVVSAAFHRWAKQTACCTRNPPQVAVEIGLEPCGLAPIGADKSQLVVVKVAGRGRPPWQVRRRSWDDWACCYRVTRKQEFHPSPSSITNPVAIATPFPHCKLYAECASERIVKIG